MQWTVLLPVKALPEAKSRLAPATADGDAHRRLVEAIRRDTADAARAARNVARVLVVVDRGPAGPGQFVQSAPGLNAAVREGARYAAAHWPDHGLAALVGDLPALRPDELAEALDAAATYELSFVADHTGTGTTLLAATPGNVLRPAFGAGSAQRHSRAAVPLPAGPGLRRDVDTGADLLAAHALGVGPATGAVLAAETNAFVFTWFGHHGLMTANSKPPPGSEWKTES